MTHEKESADIDFDYDLVFDETEVGAAQYTYYGLLTDFQSPADILIRIDVRKDPDFEAATALAKEVVKRWNANALLKDTATGEGPITDQEEVGRFCDQIIRQAKILDWKGFNRRECFADSKDGLMASISYDEMFSALSQTQPAHVEAKSCSSCGEEYMPLCTCWPKTELQEVMKQVRNAKEMHGARAYYHTEWIDTLLSVAESSLPQAVEVEKPDAGQEAHEAIEYMRGQLEAAKDWFPPYIQKQGTFSFDTLPARAKQAYEERRNLRECVTDLAEFVRLTSPKDNRLSKHAPVIRACREGE